jgi:hypothetical protein
LGYDVWNYIFQDLPIEVSIKVAKAVAEIARIVISDDVMTTVIEKLEKETVQRSVEYAMEQLFKSDVRVAFGATRVKYDTGKVKVDSNLQYIMVYTPIDKEKGNIVVRIYSPYEIEPPVSHGSVGMIIGFVNNLPEGEKIPPFIVEFKGVIGKKHFPWDYQWYEDPSIAVYFPDDVPDFGFRPVSVWDKYIVNPVKEAIEGVTGFFGKFFPKGEVVEYLSYEEQSEEVKQEVEEMSNNVNDYMESKEEVKQEEKKEEIKETPVPKEKPPETQEKRKECVLTSNNPKRNVVLINEVAWMGTKNSANDEWIELKNIGNTGVNIKGWSLYDRDKQINVFFEKDYIVPAYGFVLLERTDDTSVPFMAADFIYSGAISNKDESLYLFDSNCGLQDFVEANSQWPAGQSEERRTMERGDDLSWHSYSGGGYMDIFGTPKQENSFKIVNEESVGAEQAVEENSNSNSSSIIGVDIVSYCPQSYLGNPTLSPIVINEIAWMGTQFSSSDEWIELKNISANDVSLNSWQLLDKDNQIKVIFDASDVVPANGFYLLERTDDSSVPGMSLNKKYSGALSDTDESLRLFNSGCELVDEAKAEENWPAGDKDNRKTMERSGNLSGWHTYSLLTPDDDSGLFGTPKRENSELAEENQQQEDEEENNNEQSQAVPGLIISEIELGDENGYEYVEIFNQSEETIDLCPDENNCYYLSYFSNQEQEHNWDDPNHSWPLKELTINSNSYLLLGDEEVASVKIESFQLNNSSASLALFFSNPVYGGEEEKTQEEKTAYAQSLKIDAVAWKDKIDDPEPEVKEGQSFVLIGKGVLGRKYTEGKYIDSNNNFNDFEMQKKSPEGKPSYSPEAINDLSIQGAGSRRNSVVLSWAPPFDPDTSKDNLDYEVFYSLNQGIDTDNLIQIDSYVDVEIDKKEDSVSVLVSDLYYSNYVFAVKAKDQEGNYSPPSNIVNHSISPTQHIKSSPYIDYGRRNKSSFSGPANGTVIETMVLIKGEDDNDGNDSLSSPLIDENGDIYFSGRLDDSKGVFVFNDNVKKWFYECSSGCDRLFLNSDGTVYAFNGTVLIALSPSGKLKWQEDLSQAYALELVIDSNKTLYLLGSFQGTPSLFVLRDRQSMAEITTFGLGANYEHFSNLVLDSQNNVYFFADTTLFKFTAGGKTGERIIEIVYDEGYEGDENRTGRVVDLALSSQGTFLFNVIDGGCDKDGKSYNIFYALSKDNISSNPSWTQKDFYYGPIGINGEEFFIQATPPGSFKYHLYLYGIDVLTGETNWAKHWYGDSPPLNVSAITSDNDNNIYFTQGGEVWSYNLDNISDETPQNDRILSAPGANPNIVEPVALGQGVMYVFGGKTISRVVFNP